MRAPKTDKPHTIHLVTIRLPKAGPRAAVARAVKLAKTPKIRNHRLI